LTPSRILASSLRRSRLTHPARRLENVKVTKHSLHFLIKQVKSDYIGRIVVGRKCWDRSGRGRFVRSFVYGVVLVVNVLNVETFCLKMKYESAIIAAVICFVLVGVTEGRLSEIRVVLFVGVQPEVSYSRTCQNIIIIIAADWHVPTCPKLMSYAHWYQWKMFFAPLLRTRVASHQGLPVAPT